MSTTPSPTLTAEELASWIQQSKAVQLYDIRTITEKQLGNIPSSISFKDEQELVNFAQSQKGTPIVIYCQSGERSLAVAEKFLEAGIKDCRSLAGGFRQWQSKNYPVEKSCFLSTEETERYSRQIVLPQVGISGQVRLKKAKVLVVGAGGLGSPAILYLAAAGVGTLGIVDPDNVELSNLHRQILHANHSIGDSKVNSAKETLHKRNPHTSVRTLNTLLSSDNIRQLIWDFDLVVDGSDNFETRYVINDACYELNKPWVHGSVSQFEGRITSFVPAKNSPCYRCLYPKSPEGAQRTCQDEGVLGVVPGIIGILQANEAIKILLGIGVTGVGRLNKINLLSLSFSSFSFPKNPTCPLCG